MTMMMITILLGHLEVEFITHGRHISVFGFLGFLARMQREIPPEDRDEHVGGREAVLPLRNHWM